MHSWQTIPARRQAAAFCTSCSFWKIIFPPLFSDNLKTRDIHTLRSGEKLSVEVETESDDMTEADFVCTDWSEWEVEALQRDKHTHPVCENCTIHTRTEVQVIK